MIDFKKYRPMLFLQQVKLALEKSEQFSQEVSEFYHDRIVEQLRVSRDYISSIKVEDVHWLEDTRINRIISQAAAQESKKDGRPLDVDLIIKELKVEETKEGYKVGFPHLRYYPGTKIPMDELFTVLDVGFVARNIPGLNLTAKAERATEGFAERLKEKYRIEVENVVLKGQKEAFKISKHVSP